MDREEVPRGTWIVLAGAVAAVALGVLVWLLSFHSGKAQVSGTVTLDGKAVPGAQVVFLGEDEKNEAPIVAVADDEGKYRLIGHDSAGIPTGKYRVAVSKMALKDGTVPVGERLEQARAQGLLRNVLPKVYEDRATTPLQFDVQAGSRTINLELKSGP
jgi:hypothetical protein